MSLNSRNLLPVFAALVLAATLASPASAQLVHRNRDGNLVFNPLACQTDYQIRQTFAAQGYTNIKLNAPIESMIQVRASRGNRIYLIDYNYCLGRIDGITPLRAAR